MESQFEASTATTRRAHSGPRGLPLVGVALDLRRDPLRYFVDLMLEYGEVVRFRIGQRPIIMLNHPDDIKHVLQDNHQNYHKSPFYRAFRPIFGQSIFLSEGKTWLDQRRTAKPAFGGPRFDFMTNQIGAAAADMLGRWDSAERQGKRVELVEEMMRLTLDAVTRALLDMRLNAEYRRIHEALTVILRETERRVWSVFPLPEWLTELTRPRYREAISSLDQIVWSAIEECRRDPRDSDGLLSTLVKAYEAGTPANDRTLRDQVCAMIATGHESTACALAWTLYIMATDPLAERLIYREVDEVLHGRVPTVEDIPRLTNIEMVFQEAMRLYPPVWTISRIALTDDYVRGTRIPKGTTVMLSPYAVHRHPAIWEKPEQFAPSRFSAEAVASRHRYAYFPFGGGPRVCLGNRFAMLEAKVILAMAAQRYRFSLEPDQTIEAEPMITLRPRNGIFVHLTRRASAPTREKAAA